MHTDTAARLDAWLQAAEALLADPAAGSGGEVAGDTDHPDPAVPLGKLWVRLRKERDLELHVRTGWLFGTEFVQLLDYVPSTGRYETSVLVERALLGRLLEDLAALDRYAAGTAGVRP
ncbi:MAG: hypothetical protein QOI86_2748 [Actinomycetota bacterium]|nr:hypothetical protein [Actinomycetota bacterium]